MAAITFSLPYKDVALAAATAKTVAMVTAPANQRVVIEEIHVGFDGTTANNTPVLIELCSFSTAGTFTAGTPIKLESSLSETIQSTTGINASVEPTLSTTIKQWRVHPQGNYEKTMILNVKVIIPGGGKFGIRLTAAQIVNVTGFLTCTE